jgi:hypothetical protein
MGNFPSSSSSLTLLTLITISLLLILSPPTAQLVALPDAPLQPIPSRDMHTECAVLVLAVNLIAIFDVI